MKQGRTPGHAAGHTPGKIPRKIVLAFAVSITVIICASAAGLAALKYWHPLKESGTVPIKSSAKSSSAPSSSKPQWDSGFTDFLICGIDNTDSLTDVIMIVGFDNKSKKVNILQIPRDTYAGGNVPTHKYNAVYGCHKKGESGMETLKAQVESDFGIKIGSYAAVTTRGLRRLVDGVGGVDLVVPINMNYDDSYQNLHIHLNAGRQHLDGAKAEQFVRYRKGWIQGDVGRLNAQKLFLAAFTQKLKSMNTVQIAAKLLPVVSAPDFVTDLSAYDMLALYGSAKEVSYKNASVYTMPGEGYTGFDGASLYSVHKKELLKILNKGFVPSGVRLKLSDLKIEQEANAEPSNDDGSSFSKIINQQKNKNSNK